MTSKKPPSSKRSALPRTSDYTKTFLKDWERLTRSGRFDMNRLKEVMLLLIAKDGPLGPEWTDHPLKGNKAAFRECHVGGDFLLIHSIEATPQGEAVVFAVPELTPNSLANEPSYYHSRSETPVEGLASCSHRGKWTGHGMMAV